MKRKIIQIADSTQLISLPRKWALKYNVKKGDELNVEEKGSSLVICSDKALQMSSVEVDLSDLDRTSILFYVQELYRLGYDEIKIKFSNPTVEHYRAEKSISTSSVLHHVASRLIGMEIIQQKEGFVVFKSLQEISEKELDTVVDRILLLLQDAFDDFINAIRKNDHTQLMTIEEKHESITKFVSYGMRILNKKGAGDFNNLAPLYHILGQLDRIIDIIKYTEREIIDLGKPISKESIELIEDISKSYYVFASFFKKFDKKAIRELYLNRDQVIRKIKEKVTKVRPEELRLIEYLRSALDFLVDATEARIGLEH